AWAIAENLAEMVELKTPIVSVVIGEGGSGGALAIGVADRLLMLENATYSVVSPEGCASILWNDAALAPQAAVAMKLSAKHVAAAGVADGIVPEPEDGAHTDYVQAGTALHDALVATLEEIDSTFGRDADLNVAELLEARYQKYRHVGLVLEEQ